MRRHRRAPGEVKRRKRQQSIDEMRRRDRARYWWDYMRIRSCLFTWLVERREEERRRKEEDPNVTTVLTGGGYTVTIRRDERRRCGERRFQ